MVDIGATVIGSSLIGTANINPIMHLICWCMGGSVLIWGAILKKIPAHHFDKVADKISLEEEREDDPLNKMFSKATEIHAKARRSIGIPHDGDETGQSVSVSKRVIGDDTNEHEDESEDQQLVHPKDDDSNNSEPHSPNSPTNQEQYDHD